jgi:hypothetical protein
MLSLDVSLSANDVDVEVRRSQHAPQSHPKREKHFGPARVTDVAEVNNVARVKLGRDFGTKTEILSGLDPQERVVQNPANDLYEGMPVSIQSTTQGKPAS